MHERNLPPPPEQRLESVLTVSSDSLVPCAGCGKPFAQRRPNHRYCSPACRMAAFQAKQGKDRAERDAKVRLKLREAIELLEDPTP